MLRIIYGANITDIPNIHDEAATKNQLPPAYIQHVSNKRMSETVEHNIVHSNFFDSAISGMTINDAVNNIDVRTMKNQSSA